MNETRLKELLASVLSVEAGAIGPTCTMDTVENWDSLKHMELISGIESEFSFELTFDEIVEMRSYDMIRKVLVARGLLRE
ncbi:MAG: acyl carrier protein [Verrucomicrobia bacterium]|nr:acyl carrier protein [Verrucomicrobiota bacterium]